MSRTLEIFMEARRMPPASLVERGRCVEPAMLNRTLISIVDDDQLYRESLRKLVVFNGLHCRGVSVSGRFPGVTLFAGNHLLDRRRSHARNDRSRAAQAFGRCRVRDPDDPRYRLPR